MASGCMQKSVSLIVCSLILCGCTQREYPGLKQLASGLERPWPGSRSPSMTMTVRESGGHMVLHCRLQNLSSAALTFDRSRLPWNQPIFFTGNVVTSTGHAYPLGPVGIRAYIVGMPHAISLGPNGVLEGDFEVKYLLKNPMVGPPTPQGEDALFLWSYNLPTYGETLRQHESRSADTPMQIVRLIGITFLPKQAIALLAK
jgi:hypothetical protein